MADLFGVDPEKLRQIGDNYQTRPEFMVDIAKKLLGVIARLIGEIVEKEQTKEMLHAVVKRNQALLDSSPVCHKIVDLDFNLRYMSANGFKMLKLDDNARVYGKPYPFEFFPSSFRDEMTRNLKKVKETGDSINMEALTRDIEGNAVWLDSALIPIFDDNGEIEYLTVVSADTTRRKSDEEERNRLEAQLRQSQKMEAVGRLAGGVAHDFNNMLSVILGNAEMATEMVMDELDAGHPLNDSLDEIQNAALRSTNVVRQLLAFARKQTIVPKVLDLNDTVDDMLKMLHRLIGEDIDLSWRPGSNLWSVHIDPGQIDQILANLAVNGRDAISDVGKLTIETRNVVFDEAYCANNPGFIPGEFVLLAVSDNGCGMDRETQENLFEPFFTTKEVGKGTGLGLATVFGIVKQNNGFINVYSEPNQGTSFRIFLARYSAPVEQGREQDRTEQTSRENETILLVEDEPSILKMTTMMLEKLGYGVVAARTPGEAIQLAEAHVGDIRLLLTDVVMPDMNGRDLAGKILPIYPEIKRLFMSGYTANVIAHHGVLDEGVNFIQKPFSRQELGAKIRGALDNGDG
jgi:PAS domain S-box-containing protein